MNPRKPAPVSDDEAQVLALQALSFLACDTSRLSRFMELTGLTPTDLHTRADTIEVQSAVLGHLMGTESDLMVFAAEHQLHPETIGLAFHRLAPPTPNSV